MKKINQEVKTRRIKLRYEFEKAEQIERTVRDFVEFANNRVIPIMKALLIPVTKENVLKYAQNSELMKKDHITLQEQSAGLENNYLKELVINSAIKNFDDVFNNNPYDDRCTNYPQMMKLSDGLLIIDDEAIREAATVYVVDTDELEAYDRHQAAVEALNKFFNGKAPEGISITNYFPVVGGVVKAGTLVSYKQFVKH
jgi:predicted heme/steroid binding protein